MPNYRYECTNCGHAFTEFQGISEPLLTECPSCHQSSLRRLIGGGMGIIFKGSGFYTTDYKNSNRKTASDKSSSSESCSSCACQSGGSCGED